MLGKPKKIDRFIKSIGGKPNGTGQTWTFTTMQVASHLRKTILTVVLIVTSVIALATQISTFKGIPPRLNNLETSNSIIAKQVDKNTVNIEYTKHNTVIIREDIRDIKRILMSRR